MRRLVPDHAELALEDAYRGLVLPPPPLGRGRATLVLGMVASADGAVTVDGRSAGLGGAADGQAFRRLRDACDAIVVGAGTARAEDYGPPRAAPARVAARRAAGLAPAPQLLVVTRDVALDPQARLFTADRDPGVPRPVVVTAGSAPAERIGTLEAVTDVLRFGTTAVDLPGLLRWCHDQGLDRVLCEGGPRLNGALLAAGLVDELFLTIDPTLVAGDAGRIVRGPLPGPVGLELVELHEHEGELLLRYRVPPDVRPPG